MARIKLDPSFELLLQIAAAKLPNPMREVRAVPGRKFRFDFGWAITMTRWVLVEVQGGIWTRGAHVRPMGVSRDAEKVNLAQLQGHICLQVTPEMIRDGRAMTWIREALKGRGVAP